VVKLVVIEARVANGQGYFSQTSHSLTQWCANSFQMRTHWLMKRSVTYSSLSQHKGMHACALQWKDMLLRVIYFGFQVRKKKVFLETPDTNRGPRLENKETDKPWTVESVQSIQHCVILVTQACCWARYP
jgi:hypothetical protein